MIPRTVLNKISISSILQKALPHLTLSISCLSQVITHYAQRTAFFRILTTGRFHSEIFTVLRYFCSKKIALLPQYSLKKTIIYRQTDHGTNLSVHSGKSTELLLVLPTWHCAAQNEGYFTDSLLVCNYQIPYCLMILWF